MAEGLPSGNLSPMVPPLSNAGSPSGPVWDMLLAGLVATNKPPCAGAAPAMEGLPGLPIPGAAAEADALLPPLPPLSAPAAEVCWVPCTLEQAGHLCLPSVHSPARDAQLSSGVCCMQASACACLPAAGNRMLEACAGTGLVQATTSQPLLLRAAFALDVKQYPITQGITSPRPTLACRS